MDAQEITLVIKIDKDSDPGLVATLRVLAEYLKGTDSIEVDSGPDYTETQFVTRATVRQFLLEQGEPATSAPSKAERLLGWLWQRYGKGPLPGLLVVCTKCEKLREDCRCHPHAYQGSEGLTLHNTWEDQFWKYGLTSLLNIDPTQIEGIRKVGLERLTAFLDYLRAEYQQD